MNARSLHGVVSDLTGGSVSVNYDMPAQEVCQHLPSAVNAAEADPRANQALFRAELGSTPAP
eukprot:12188429-Prorocentrum_lima.AAC.1